MKVIIKIAVFLLGIFGVLYWLATVAVRPAANLWSRHKAKKEAETEYLVDGDEDL